MTTWRSKEHDGTARRCLTRFTAAALLGAGMVQAIAPSGVYAAPPEEKFTTEVIDEEFFSLQFSLACGFLTWYTLQGTVTVVVQGDLTVVRYHALERTLHGPGGSLTLRETGVDQIRTELTEDGFVEAIHGAGRFNHSWVVPGYGPVELNAGTGHFELTHTWDEATQSYVVTEAVLHEGGPRDRELTPEDTAALCAHLG